MVHDVISPPAAARYYAYSCLAGYLVTENSIGFLDKLNGFEIKTFKTKRHANQPLATSYALIQVAKQMLPSGYQLEKIQLELIAHFKGKLSEKSLEQSLALGNLAANHVLEYAKTDLFNELSAKVGYTPTLKPGYWYPTPPAYMEAVEPHWNTVRTFFIESADQFKPVAPTPFSMDSESDFYKIQLMGVYNAVKNLNEEQTLIANFWDCNPFMVEYTGHMAIGIKKITPGGHWMGITGIACKKANLNFAETVKTHALVSLTLHDAFVNCWDEKYRSNRIRPETVINKHIDQQWKPILQTPPFPEYTSGHSVASSAASTMLTKIFGENFDFVDDTEVFFGLEERHFKSFKQASNEAAISRLYGGIHYIDACENGVQQGTKLGTFIVNKVFDK
ncbi:hypothetical protein JCM19301_2009 [Jejuia pallidilutea]|uniref:Phosphatidic acid phosphatase type 2/haloperoxidase domain-containing protein n=2 Tax=Jejuia pallidilutea TaxID=504487 RepID=A0A090W835_9FLAO|nr:hypothetical protein JCM19301_2009 [Jejuia pallidilutea]GAL72363.1 hypothetical protein JCM19302_3641 [Jejuia pallidilutea]GAL89487.1 hypothetical protein JCM19538_1724 [Jejuia pallidilutea]